MNTLSLLKKSIILNCACSLNDYIRIIDFFDPEILDMLLHIKSAKRFIDRGY